MVMISPQIATTNSAPADRRTSRTLTAWPSGAPLVSGLVEKLYWVLATQIGTGRSPSPRMMRAGPYRFVGRNILRAINFAGDGADFFVQRHVVGIEKFDFALARFAGTHDRARDIGRALTTHRPMIGHVAFDAEFFAGGGDQRILGGRVRRRSG